MRMPPMYVISDWPTPNYEDPVTQGPSLLIVNGVFMTLVVLAVVARFYSRLCIQKWFGVDDAMMVLAFIFTIAMTVVVVLADVRYGWDRHIWDLHPNMIQSANIIAFVAKLTFTLAATFTRLSLICFYYRLVKDSGIRWFIWVLHASMIWQIALCITFVCLTVWLCNPIESYWLFPPSGSPYQCLHEGKVMLGAGIVSSFSDFLTVVLPIPLVMRLQMPLWHRIGVCILLGLGVIVTVAGSLRTYWTWKSLMQSWDETWYAYPLWIAAAVEIDLGVICACAPALKSLLRRPLRELSGLISDKLSSLRSPSNTQDTSSAAAGGKPGLFSPLRSLTWFHITHLDFVRTRKADNTDPRRSHLDPDSSSAIELRPKHLDDDPERQQSTGAVDLRPPQRPHAVELLGSHSRPSTPSLQIMMRHSFDQCSDYVADESYELDASPAGSGKRQRYQEGGSGASRE